MSAGQSPNPTPLDSSPFTIKGRVTDSDTGTGIPGAPVAYGHDSGCLLENGHYGFSKTAPLGTRVQVNGSVASTSTFPASSCAVALQRLTGATQWRGQSLARVRLSGRYTLIARPLLGRNNYRTLFPRCFVLRQGMSAPFIITAT